MAPLSRLTVAVLSGLLCVSCSRSPEPAPAQPQAASPVPAPVCQVLELVERFGVSHPTQIVDFDLPAPLAGPDVRVLDGEGQEVCGQLLDGGRRIALMTDLPAGQSRSWTMYAGQRPAAFEGGIAVTETPEQYEIANGLVGVRVPGPPTAPPALDALPAPVQGVCMRDGTWAATGPNRLAAEASTLVAMTTRFLERGPLRVVVEVAYAFERPEYRYGQTHVADAGPGYYRSTLTVEAGQPVILFEEDTDMDLSYSMDFHAAVHPTHARYRGHHARATEYGAEPDGRVYRASHERPALDAEVELRYDRPVHSSYGSSPDSWRWMAVWDPWVFDSGWYWQAFDAAAAADGNLLGIFAGRASRAIGAHFSGVGLYTLPAPEGGQPQAGLTVQSHRRGADGRVARRSRWQWGLFAGVKGEDLRDATEVQPIARLANVHAGFGLNKLHRVGLDFADPAAGWGAMYMPPDAVQAMIERLRNDPEFHRRAYDTVTYTRPLIDAWCDATGAKREAVLEQLAADAGDLLRRHVEGDGAMDFHVHYWHGSLRMSRAAAWLDSLLAAPDLMGEQRQRCKAILALYAAVVWDDDVVPLFEGHGLNLGTANMPVQYQGVRDLYALMLARHPMMRGRAEGVWQRAQATVHETINEHGAHMGCTHYIGAANGLLLSILQQLKMSGLADPFKE